MKFINSFGNSHVSGQSLLTYKHLSECIKKKISWAGVVGCGFVFFLMKLIMHFKCFWFHGSSSSSTI